MPCLYCRNAAKCLEGEITVIGVVFLADVRGSVADGIHGIIEELHGFVRDDVTNLFPFVVLILFLDTWVIIVVRVFPRVDDHVQEIGSAREPDIERGIAKRHGGDRPGGTDGQATSRDISARAQLGAQHGRVQGLVVPPPIIVPVHRPVEGTGGIAALVELVRLAAVLDDRQLRPRATGGGLKTAVVRKTDGQCRQQDDDRTDGQQLHQREPGAGWGSRGGGGTSKPVVRATANHKTSCAGSQSHRCQPSINVRPTAGRGQARLAVAGAAGCSGTRSPADRATAGIPWGRRRRGPRERGRAHGAAGRC